MKKILKNSKMVVMLNSLRPLLSHKDKIGYIAARNYRILSETLTEYEAFRNGLFEKYGEKCVDEHDIPIYHIKVDTQNFKAFCEEMRPFDEMEHEVDLMTANFKDVIGCLSGEEILAVDWMLED